MLLMIEQHMGIWLWRGPNRGEGLADYSLFYAFNGLGGGAAPLFVTLAGIGSSLMIAKRTRRGEGVDLTLTKRGLTLMGFGLLLNLMTPSWFSWRSWFVLHLMGFGMLMTPLLRRLSERGLIVAGFVVLALTPVVQIAWSSPLDLTNLRMSGFVMKKGVETLVPYAALRIPLAEGQFPIFGWLSFFIFGLAAGRSVEGDQSVRVLKLGGIVLMLGSIGAAIGWLAQPALGSYVHRASRLYVPFFPASPALLALLAGAVLLAVGLVMRAGPKLNLHERHLMVTLGRASLSLLLLHVYLFRELSRPAGLWRALEVGPTLAFIAGFAGCAFVAAWLWQRIDYRFGAEWLLRKLAP